MQSCRCILHVLPAVARGGYPMPKKHAHCAEVPWTTTRWTLTGTSGKFVSQDAWPVRGSSQRPTDMCTTTFHGSNCFRKPLRFGSVTEFLPTLPVACRTADDETRNRPPTRPGRRSGTLGSTSKSGISAAEQDLEMLGVPTAKDGLAQDDLCECGTTSRSATPRRSRSKAQCKTCLE